MSAAAGSDQREAKDSDKEEAQEEKTAQEQQTTAKTTKEQTTTVNTTKEQQTTTTEMESFGPMSAPPSASNQNAADISTRAAGSGAGGSGGSANNSNSNNINNNNNNNSSSNNNNNSSNNNNNNSSGSAIFNNPTPPPARGPPRTPGMDRRTVRIEARSNRGQTTEQEYVSNIIISSKYTVWNFVPKNFLEQFRKAVNSYFLIITFVMFLGNKTPLFRGTINFVANAATLLTFMVFSAVVAALDDMGRHRADAETNAETARFLSFSEDGNPMAELGEWRDVRVGDILIIHDQEHLPADIVPLATSGLEGSCYVSTAQLDGETNLKAKSVPPLCQEELGRLLETAEIEIETVPESSQATLAPPDLEQGSVKTLLVKVASACRSLKGDLVAEAPQRSIHSFTGTLTIGAATDPLEIKELLLRGTQLRNTAWCIGVVIYTGTETRMAMNSRQAPTKVANIERIINRTLGIIVAVQVLLALVSAVAYALEQDYFNRLPYLSPPESIIPASVSVWLTMLVLYSPLMPISLYATMEVCNYAHGYFIENDAKMYYEPDDIPAKVRTTNLGHELGQVSYIFSDKTGTLTQNVMQLKQVSVRGSIYGALDGKAGFTGAVDLQDASRNNSDKAKANEEFLEILAVSHSVLATIDGNGARVYEAESPDESALVSAAADAGWTFHDRERHQLSVLVRDPKTNKEETRMYTIQALNAFTSARKRQSVVALRPESGERVVLVKGADNVMMARAAKVEDWLEPHLRKFSSQGLRTLVLGSRPLSDDDWETFRIAFETAQKAMDNREQQLAAAADLVECDLKLVGITAIEDKLQENVEDTIEVLREAGIKLWVLTGDKLETARNIGFSTRVLTDSMSILTIDADSCPLDAIAAYTAECCETARNYVETGVVVALLITGQALELLSSGGDDDLVLRLGSYCSVVIACRVSPLQKAQLVRLVRYGVHPTPVTLAVGDGANDVPMIQEAQVGIGIAGREGKQAVNSADVGIGQFQYLQRLLLVHGRWNYRRACKYTLYSFWRAAVMVLLMAWYVFISGFAGTSLFENWVRASYNIVLGVPILCTGIFDRDVSEEEAIENPKLYGTGRKGVELNAWKLCETLASSCIHALALVATTYLSEPHFVAYGNGDYYTMGAAIFTWLIITQNYRVAFLTTTWNVFSLAGLVLSFLMYAVFLFGYCAFKWKVASFSPWMYGILPALYETPAFWISCFVAPGIAMSLDVLKYYLVLAFAPDERDIILEAAADRPSGSTENMLDEAAPPAELTFRQQQGSLGSPLVDSQARPRGLHHVRSAVEVSMRPSASLTAGPASFGGMSGSRVRAMPRREVAWSSFDWSAVDGMGPDIFRCAPSHRGDNTLPSFSTSHGGWNTFGGRTPGVSFPNAGANAAAGASLRAPSPRARLPSNPQDASHRPSRSAFAQQKLPSVQFEPRRWSACLLFGVGLLLVGLGAFTRLWKNAGRVVVTYDGPAVDNPDNLNRIIKGDVHACHVQADQPEASTCELTFKVKEHMEAPISVDYSIDPYYQNHASYIDSVLFDQLEGKTLSWKSPGGEHCSRRNSVTPDEKTIFPCGFPATTLFNDQFEFPGLTKVFRTTGVAWRADMSRYKNPIGYPHEGGYSWLFERYPDIISEEDGVHNEAFAAWMRVGFSPSLVKRYGFIDRDLKAGEVIRVKISSRFLLHEGASKSLFITERGFLGGPEFGFSSFLVVFGVLCLLSSGFVKLTEKYCPRRRGRVRDHWCCKACARLLCCR